MGFTFFCPKCKEPLRQVSFRREDDIEEDYKCDKCNKFYRPDFGINDGLVLWELLGPEDYIKGLV